MIGRTWIAIARWGILTVVGGLGFFNIYSAHAQELNPIDYLLASQRINLITQPQAVIPVVVPIKNTSAVPWDSAKLELGTVYSTADKNRPSAWKTADWESATRIRLSEPDRWIMPNQIAEFRFTMQSPKFFGQYREYFQPVLDEVWLTGDPVVLQIQVGEEVVTQSTVSKEIRVYRKSQTAEWLESGFVVATLPISSGKTGYATPAGRYTIINHAKEAYSEKYSLYMGNWMGLAREGVGFQGFGLHSLAYWKTTNHPYADGTIKNGRLYIGNRVYEDALHLGKAMSHGCIRQGVEESAVAYDWAPDGTLVTVI
jgi:hypothetical protein